MELNEKTGPGESGIFFASPTTLPLLLLLQLLLLLPPLPLLLLPLLFNLVTFVGLAAFGVSIVEGISSGWSILISRRCLARS